MDEIISLSQQRIELLRLFFSRFIDFEIIHALRKFKILFEGATYFQLVQWMATVKHTTH